MPNHSDSEVIHCATIDLTSYTLHRPSHVFQCMRERPGQSGDVVCCAVVYLCRLAHAVSYMVNPWPCSLRGRVGGDTQLRLKPHLITSPDRADHPDSLCVFLAYIEKHGKAPTPYTYLYFIPFSLPLSLDGLLVCHSHLHVYTPSNCISFKNLRT